MRAIAFLLFLPVLAAGGCAAPAVQIGSASRPAAEIQIEPVELRVDPEAVSMRVEPGAVSPGAITLSITVDPGAVQIKTADIPERPLNVGAWWLGATAAAVVGGYWVNRWIRLAFRRRA